LPDARQLSGLAKKDSMKAATRRTIEMATRVLNFSLAHPDASPGYAVALARLQKTLAQVEAVATRQRDGLNAVRSATARKRELRRRIRRTQLVHLARVSESAVSEVPEIAQKFVLVREGVPYLAFRTAARGMSAEAQNQKELLVRHGLLDSVLESLAQSLDQFDQAVEQGTSARRAHIGASAELDALAEELIQIVRLMDGSNRYRFSGQPDSMAEWESARNTVGPARSSGGQADRRTGGQSTTPPASPAGEIKAA
jgi:hypothetical protein